MPSEISKQELERLVELLGDIPPVPSVATKILEVANAETANAADVTRLIAIDQGLTSKLLTTCNSPYYGLRQKVKTLSRAVGLLGFKAVRNLVLVHSLPWNRSAQPLFTEQIIRIHRAGEQLGEPDLGPEGVRLVGEDGDGALRVPLPDVVSGGGARHSASHDDVPHHPDLRIRATYKKFKANSYVALAPMTRSDARTA